MALLWNLDSSSTHISYLGKNIYRKRIQLAWASFERAWKIKLGTIKANWMTWVGFGGQSRKNAKTDFTAKEGTKNLVEW